jgi:hypothetical protein
VLLDQRELGAYRALDLLKGLDKVPPRSAKSV